MKLYVTYVSTLLACLLASVAAQDHYRHGLERVWLWYAYRIDLLNIPSDRMLGYRCEKWDRTDDVCLGNWRVCQGTLPDQTCTYRELLQFMRNGNARDEPRVYPLPGGADRQNNLTPDIIPTVRRLEELGRAHVTPFQVHQVLRHSDGVLYGQFIMDVNKHLRQTYNRLNAQQRLDAARFFDPLKTATDLVIEARLVDHHSNPLGPKEQVASKLFDKHKIKIVYKKHPDVPTIGAESETVNWKETVENSKIPNARKLVTEALNEYYDQPGRDGVLAGIIGTY